MGPSFEQVELGKRSHLDTDYSSTIQLENFLPYASEPQPVVLVAGPVTLDEYNAAQAIYKDYGKMGDDLTVSADWDNDLLGEGAADNQDEVASVVREVSPHILYAGADTLTCTP